MIVVCSITVVGRSIMKRSDKRNDIGVRRSVWVRGRVFIIQALLPQLPQADSIG